MKEIKIHGFSSTSSSSSFRFLSKLIFLIIIITILTYIFHSFSSDNVAGDFIRPSSSNNLTNNISSIIRPSNLAKVSSTAVDCKKTIKEKTQLHHLVFAIASSSKVWQRRQNYVKLWWKPNKMQGFVWLEERIKNQSFDHQLPTIKISSNTSEFKDQYNNHESAVRIARVVSETFRLGSHNNVRWFIMADDDTFVVTDNLLRVLRKYDHNQFYYIGGSSETHLQNIIFGYNTAFGGGGFAISYPLAKAMTEIQDACMKRYNNLYTSDHRIQACMAEIGVPLTREVGFHQLDVLGNVFGIIATHPVAPLVSLHHLDLFQPIFPNASQLQSLERLKTAMDLDSAGLAQQSICYDSERNWTVSVSWGYAVQIIRGILSARMMERPPRTFYNWYKTNNEVDFAFSTRDFFKNACQRPFVHMFTHGSQNSTTNQTSTTYLKFPNRRPRCRWKSPNPDRIEKVNVYKKSNPHRWDNKAPRRDCCRVLPSENNDVLMVEVEGCRVGEFVELNLA